MVRKFFLGLLMTAAVLLNGCVIQPVNAPSGGGISPSPDGQGDRPATLMSLDEDTGSKLKPLDPLYIRFSGIMEQQQLEVVISEKGEINLLHIKDPIKAAGLTPSQLATLIERLYVDGGIYKNVSVNVTMTAKVYYVQGEVLQPGQFQLMSGTTLMQAVAGARGFTPYANKRKITLTRHGQVYTYNYKELEKDPSQDVKIKAGDVIKVWQSPW